MSDLDTIEGQHPSDGSPVRHRVKRNSDFSSFTARRARHAHPRNCDEVHHPRCNHVSHDFKASTRDLFDERYFGHTKPRASWRGRRQNGQSVLNVAERRYALDAVFPGGANSASSVPFLSSARRTADATRCSISCVCAREPTMAAEATLCATADANASAALPAAIRSEIKPASRGTSIALAPTRRADSPTSPTREATRAASALAVNRTEARPGGCTADAMRAATALVSACTSV